MDLAAVYLSKAPVKSSSRCVLHQRGNAGHRGPCYVLHQRYMGNAGNRGLAAFFTKGTRGAAGHRGLCCECTGGKRGEQVHGHRPALAMPPSDMCAFLTAICCTIICFEWYDRRRLRSAARSSDTSGPGKNRARDTGSIY